MNIEYCQRTTAPGQCFSILIPSWNNLPYLKLCVEAIRKNSFHRHQVLVHINEGIDGSLEWVKQQPDIDYTYSKTNLGVCYTLNALASLAHTNYILYINDDMYTCPNWDKYLMDEITAVGHKYFFISGTAIEAVPQSRCSIAYNFGRDINSFDEQKLLKEYEDLPMQDWSGATWPPNVVHKDIWNLVGGYSIEFSPGMYSDPDFSMKLWQAGVRYFKGVSKSRVYHFGSLSVKRIKKNKGYYTFISKWGMTNGTFSKYYLRRGQKFTGPLTEPSASFALKQKSAFKQLIAVFKRT
ncbi:MAG: glycosyltransferase [Rhizobacter sp.]|nr:glycosyltransferase [Ferruginibacter sp.]